MRKIWRSYIRYSKKQRVKNTKRQSKYAVSIFQDTHCSTCNVEDIENMIFFQDFMQELAIKPVSKMMQAIYPLAMLSVDIVKGT